MPSLRPCQSKGCQSRCGYAVEKLERLREQGINPYPVTFPRTHTLAQIRAEAGGLPPSAHWVAAPRPLGMSFWSGCGKLCFATLRNGTSDLQIMIALDAVGPEGAATLASRMWTSVITSA